MKKSLSLKSTAGHLVVGGSMLLAVSAQAAMVTDKLGNVGYDTAVECDAAVTSGAAKFYQPFTSHPPLKRAGEANVKAMKLSELVAAQEAATRLGYDASAYSKGACDIGVGRSSGRDGVSAQLTGKWVPYGPEMSVNVYFDAQEKMVRATMQKCDNNFSHALPRPLGVTQKMAVSECFASVLYPAKFETRTENVMKVPATKRYEPVAATYKTVSEQVLVTPEIKNQIPVAATYKTVKEEIVVRPASFREEPVPATYKTVSEQIVAKPQSSRYEVIPATYKMVAEQVLVSPERKDLRVIPAVYGERDEVTVDRPATTLVKTIPATYKTETEQVLARAESLRYEPIVLPLRKVSEEVLRTEASTRLETDGSVLKTVSERVLVKEASKRLVEVPAVFETVTERVKVADASREWKRGRVWIGQAVHVRPLRGFVLDAHGRVDGSRVAVASAAQPGSKGMVDTQWVNANNTSLDDDVMCLVDVPERFETITRQILKTPATVRVESIPAEYGTVTRQVLERPAGQRTIDVPATYQTVTSQVIDTDKLRTLGYRFNDSGDIVAMPNGERVLRAAAVADAMSGTAAKLAKSAGAQSGEEGYVREIKIPAEYLTLSRQVVSAPATVRTVEVPGTTKTVKTRVVVTPARTEEVLIPAVYKSVSHQVVATPASQREITIPAVYKTVERKVVDVAATTRKIPVAEVRETSQRRVVDTPASLREVITPAVFKTLNRQVVDTPASLREIDVPAQFETLSYQFKVTDASTERRAVLCETNASPAKIREIQTALRSAGFNPGPNDGVLRADTMGAVNLYQQAKGLPVDGFLNLETVKSLGVSPN